jgi:hypothetical protein
VFVEEWCRPILRLVNGGSGVLTELWESADCCGTNWYWIWVWSEGMRQEWMMSLKSNRTKWIPFQSRKLCGQCHLTDRDWIEIVAWWQNDRRCVTRCIQRSRGEVKDFEYFFLFNSNCLGWWKNQSLTHKHHPPFDYTISENKWKILSILLSPFASLSLRKLSSISHHVTSHRTRHSKPTRRNPHLSSSLKTVTLEAQVQFMNLTSIQYWLFSKVVFGA